MSAVNAATNVRPTRMAALALCLVFTLIASLLGTAPASATPVTQSDSVQTSFHSVVLTTAANLQATSKVASRSAAVVMLASSAAHATVPKASSFRYKIRGGDTVSALAHKCHVGTAQIKRLNPMLRNINLIIKGRSLTLPCKLGASQHTTTKHVAAKQAHHKLTKKSSSSSKGASALAYAKRQLGKPYKWGAAGPHSFDCSGLTMRAWQSVGISLPHKASQQIHHGKHISRSNLRPGDLVFFYSGIKHVAIYAGNGRVIHAPRPGKHVQYIKLSYMPFKGARRP